MESRSISEQLALATEIREHAEGELLRQNELMQQELQLASEFQQAVLPDAIDLPYLKIGILYRPYAEVSGDVYDFLQNREGELAIFLGDATGHGIAAALMTMMIHIGLEGIRRNLPTDESIRILNRRIASRNTGRSVSSVFFRITPGGYLTVTHAGHPSLIVIPANGDPLVKFEKGGCAPGMFEDEPVPYEEESYQLAEGDKLFAYTDAVIEWGNHDREGFGYPRLLETLTRYRRESVDDICDLLLKEIEEFSEGRPCDDDLTALAVEFVGVGGDGSW